MSFNIGDEVIINKYGDIYSFTKPGSIGTIVGFFSDYSEYKIKFESLTCDSPPSKRDEKWTWYISANCIELLDPIPAGPYGPVIRKMKYLQHKFDTRKELANV